MAITLIKTNFVTQFVTCLISHSLGISGYGNKMVKSPFSCVILPLTQPQVANQQQQKNNNIKKNLCN